MTEKTFDVTTTATVKYDGDECDESCRYLSAQAGPSTRPAFCKLYLENIGVTNSTRITSTGTVENDRQFFSVPQCIVDREAAP
jgi:hypothetical protein